MKAEGIVAKFDDRDNLKPGFKFAEHEIHGIPLRIAIGPRDLANGTAELARRDTLAKSSEPLAGLAARIPALLETMQHDMYQKALKFVEANIRKVDTYEEFKRVLDEEGGFISAHWDGTPETEALIKEETKATIRCIPLDSVPEEGVCVRTGKPSHRRVLFARAY